MVGTITVSSITAAGFTLSWQAATDNVAVTGYEVSINGGILYTDISNVLTISETGLLPATAYAVLVRAYDAAANKAAPLSLLVTTAAGAPVQGLVEDIGYSGTVRSVTWTGLSLAGPTGSAFQWAEYADRSTTISGTFASGSATIQGSNDNVTWFPLHDTSNAEATATIPKLSQLMELTHYVRPVVTTASGSTNLTVILVMRRNWK